MLSHSILLVISIVDIRTVSTIKKKQQSKNLLSQLSERGTDFTIGQSNFDAQIKSRDSMIHRGTSSDNRKTSTQIYQPQVDIHTLEGNIVSKVRIEVDMVMTMVGMRVHDAVLTAIENLVIPRVEVAMNSANVSTGWSVDGYFWNQIKGIFRVKSKAYK